MHIYIYIYIKYQFMQFFFLKKTKVLNTCNQESTYYINAIIIKKKSKCQSHTTKNWNSSHVIKNQNQAKAHSSPQLSNQTQEIKPKWTKPSETSKWS